MIPFYSKRNQVYPAIVDGLPVVEKYFTSLSDWETEKRNYQILSGNLRVPVIHTSNPGLIVTEYLPFPTFLTVLETQEQYGFEKEPWVALSTWLRQCFDLTGQLPGDANLRNFLWDAADQVVYGLDLENIVNCTLDKCGAAMIAHLLSYDPCNSAVKCAAAETIAELLAISDGAISAARDDLQSRRGAVCRRKMSGIILAGGKSRRMGQDKADLCLMGSTLLFRQVEKMRSLGITDIMISGASCQLLPETRIIADEYEDRGPLGGLHACLKAAENPCCLVLGVDIPLLPASTLAHLQRQHSSGITVLRHPGGVEPLIGVYDSDLHQIIASLICSSGASVRRLESLVAWNYFDYLGREEMLINCNSPEDFRRIHFIAEEFSKHGLTI